MMCAMSRETQPRLQCPNCNVHLALVQVPAVPTAPGGSTSAMPTHTHHDPQPPTPQVPPIPSSPPSPPPVSEVLAEYAGRRVNPNTAMRGAARVRASLNRAQSTPQRRAAQQAARRAAASAQSANAKGAKSA